MPKIIVNHKPCLRILADGTHLEPGANTVEDEVLERALAVKHTRTLFDKGLLSHKEVPKATVSYTEGNFVPDLSVLKIADALRAVAACEDPGQLAKWMEQDGRKGVRAAMVTRHEALQPKDENEPKEEDLD